MVLYLLGLQNKPRTASAADLAKAQETSIKIEKWLNDKEGQKGVRQLGEGLLQRLQSVFGTHVDAMELAWQRAQIRGSHYQFLSADPVLVGLNTLQHWLWQRLQAPAASSVAA